MRILFAEDEYYLNEAVTKKLKQAKYSVDSCSNGEDAFDYFEAAEYDLVILDIMMPKLDGLSVLHKIRASGSKVPVILLTAKDSIEDRVKGLDSGANDYLIKPFAMDELLARIRVLLRKVDIAPTNLLQVHDLTLELDTHIVKRSGQEITLTSKEFFLRYDNILIPDGVVEFKTDNTLLFDFTLEQIPLAGWEISEYTYDLHNSPMNDGNVMTEYEEKFSSKGNPIHKLVTYRDK